MIPFRSSLATLVIVVVALSSLVALPPQKIHDMLRFRWKSDDLIQNVLQKRRPPVSIERLFYYFQMTGSAHVGFIDIASLKFSCLLVWNFFTLYNLKWLHATILLNLLTLTKMLESSFSWLRISQLSWSSNCFSQLKINIAAEFSLSVAYLGNHYNIRPYNVKGNLCNKYQFWLGKKK